MGDAKSMNLLGLTIRWVSRVLVAAVGLLLPVLPAAVHAVATPTAGAPAAYDGHHHSASLTYTTQERGPPGTYDHATAYDAVDRRSIGASARPEGATTPRAYTYDDLAGAVQVVVPTVTTWEATPDARRTTARATRTGVAAKTVPESLSFGSRAAAREGLPGDLATAGNRFFRGATSKSQDFEAVGLPGGGYRLQFFSPANNPGYGKLYVQEIDRTGQVLREYKNTMGPDGLIETKWVHGGP